MKKLFVGNLPFTATEADVRKMFESYGELAEVALIKDKFSGRSKGFAFVSVNDDEQATKAVADLDGKDFQGRAVRVNEAKPMEPGRRPERRSFGGGGGERRGGFNRDRRGGDW